VAVTCKLCCEIYDLLPLTWLFETLITDTYLCLGVLPILERWLNLVLKVFFVSVI